jgi:hypothetical protein
MHKHHGQEKQQTRMGLKGQVRRVEQLLAIGLTSLAASSSSSSSLQRQQATVQLGATLVQLWRQVAMTQ